jgi:NAD-dependent SIR2 family protein deacetylase
MSMNDAQPSPTHMIMSTLIRLGLAHYVITTNLDGKNL